MSEIPGGPWYHNPSIWAALVAWTVAQGIKFATKAVRERRLDFTCFVSTGGMPSAHSASVSAMASSIGLRTGFDGPLFALSLLFAGIVMFDAQSVRRAVGVQARLLNQMVEELFREHHLSQQKLAQFLGHTPLEVFAGMALGILTATFWHSGFPAG
jgi:acid phosphatase family membrane protein YuiD